jgi:hypothetical protein
LDQREEVMEKDNGFYFLDSKMMKRIISILEDNFFPRSSGKIIHNKAVIDLCADLEDEFNRQYQRREELKEDTGCPVCDQAPGNTTGNASTPNWVKWGPDITPLKPPFCAPEVWNNEGTWRIHVTIEKKVC